MMKMLRVLLKKDRQRLLNSIGLNKYSEGYKEKKALLIVLITVFSLITMFYLQGVYSDFLNENQWFMAKMFGIKISFVILFLFDTYVLYEYINDNEYLLLNSLPIKHGYIVISKTLILYICSLVIEMIFLLPLLVASRLRVGLIDVACSFLVIPVLVIFVCNVLLYIFSKMGRIFKLYSITRTIFILIFISAIIILLSYGKISINGIDKTDELLNKIESNGVTFIVCLILSIIFGYLSLLVLKLSINDNIKRDTIVVQKIDLDYKRKGAHKKGKLFILFVEEFKRYMSNMPYVLNTFLGGILVIFFSINSYIGSKGLGQGSMVIPNDMINSNRYVFPYILSLIVGVTSTSKVSVSVEGKCIWIKKSLPLEAKLVYYTKIFLGMVLMIFCMVVSALFLLRSGDILAVDKIYIYLILLLNSLFMSLLGIFIDIKFVNYNWNNSVEVIKRGASTIIYSIAIMFIMGVYIILLIKFKQSITVRSICIISTIIMMVFMHKTIIRKNIPD